MMLQGRPMYFVAYNSSEGDEGNAYSDSDSDSDGFSPQQDQGTWAPARK
jgi:hypothetical protein